MSLVIAAGILSGVGVLVFLHHGWKHVLEDPATSLAQRKSCPEVCCFQLSDVGNFRTCNHEMWILLFFALAILCLLFSFEEG